MRKLLYLLCLLVFTSGLVYSAPNYDPNYKTVTYDQEQYNIKLRNKLEDDFDKKYIKSVVKDKEGNITINFNYPEGAYQREVLDKYYELKKNY